MWLYYGFSSAVVLFLDVIHNPLHPEATLNLALISDLEFLCANLSSFSSGAKRVMEISKEMNKVAFDVIKAKAKRKAQDESVEQSRLKQRRVNEPEGSNGGETSVDAGSAGGGAQGASNEYTWERFPENFSWDEWDQWLNEAAL